MRAQGDTARTLERLRAEFLEMPGLRLTVPQLQRLCGVDETICKGVLDALVDAKFLAVRPDGTYAKVADGDLSRRHPAKAGAMLRADARKAS